MQLTDAQLDDIKVNYLENKKLIREWMTDNSLTQADIKPQQIMAQLREKYTAPVIQPLMAAIREDRFGMQVSNMINRLLGQPQVSVARCDKLLTRLADATITVEAKKTELQGG